MQWLVSDGGNVVIATSNVKGVVYTYHAWVSALLVSTGLGNTRAMISGRVMVIDSHVFLLFKDCFVDFSVVEHELMQLLHGY